MLAIHPDLKWVDPADVCLLGWPIGVDQSTDCTLSVKLRSFELLGECLSILHSQDALCLLQNVFSIPNVLYVLRTAPCFQYSILPDLDSLQWSLLEEICNVHLTEEVWLQASLPINVGGLGIRSFVSLTPSAYLAPAASSSNVSRKILPSSMCNVSTPFTSEHLVSRP
jgi:hypothetical protein